MYTCREKCTPEPTPRQTHRANPAGAPYTADPSAHPRHPLIIPYSRSKHRTCPSARTPAPREPPLP
eukprot:5373739-Alexandrium_andersonii.AAC.1